MLGLVRTVGVVINDQAFASVIGASFTATLMLMAWIVKTLAGLSAKVDYLDERLGRLESMNGRAAPSPRHR